MSNNSKRHVQSRRKYLKTTAAVGLFGTLAGCLGDDDGDSGDGDGDGGTDGGDDDGSNSEHDFGGAELEVMLNFAPLDEAHERFVIPEVEEKYNVSVVTDVGSTSEMLSRIRADPDNPPDVVLMDPIGLSGGSQEGILEPIQDHTDLVTNYSDVYDMFKHDEGVSWIADEVMPAIHSQRWESTPESWEAVASEDHPLALLPFSWSAGPAMVALANTIATRDDFQTTDVDEDAAFGWLEDNVRPTFHTTYDGTAQAKQMLLSGEVDTILPTWNHLMYGLWQEDAPIQTINNPDPTGIAAGNGLAVPEGSENIEAAMLYVNEVLSVEAQEEMLPIIGAGTVNQNAEVPEEVLEFGVPTEEDFETLEFPKYEYLSEEWDGWTDRWETVF